MKFQDPYQWLFPRNYCLVQNVNQNRPESQQHINQQTLTSKLPTKFKQSKGSTAQASIMMTQTMQNFQNILVYLNKKTQQFDQNNIDGLIMQSNDYDLESQNNFNAKLGSKGQCISKNAMKHYHKSFNNLKQSNIGKWCKTKQSINRKIAIKQTQKHENTPIKLRLKNYFFTKLKQFDFLRGSSFIQTKSLFNSPVKSQHQKNLNLNHQISQKSRTVMHTQLVNDFQTQLQNYQYKQMQQKLQFMANQANEYVSTMSIRLKKNNVFKSQGNFKNQSLNQDGSISPFQNKNNLNKPGTAATRNQIGRNQTLDNIKLHQRQQKNSMQTNSLQIQQQYQNYLEQANTNNEYDMISSGMKLQQSLPILQDQSPINYSSTLNKRIDSRYNQQRNKITFIKSSPQQLESQKTQSLTPVRLKTAATLQLQDSKESPNSKEQNKQVS
eukprot:403351143